MKYPILVRNSKVPRLASIFINVYAITIFPFVFIKDSGDDRLMNHEYIHFRQQKELWVLFFYIFYIFDWIIGLIKYRNIQHAYRSIRFEQEAFDNEGDWTYLLNRKPFHWRNYSI